MFKYRITVNPLKSSGYYMYPETAVAQCLRRFATYRKFAVSILDDVIWIFRWYNPSDRTMALWLTQPLTEMSTRGISWEKKRPVRKAHNPTTILAIVT